jgi:hypothetical protein
VGDGPGVEVVLGAGSVVVEGVTEVVDVVDVVVGVSIAPAPPTIGPQALSASAPAASAVTRPAPTLIRVPLICGSPHREPRVTSAAKLLYRL